MTNIRGTGQDIPAIGPLHSFPLLGLVGKLGIIMVKRIPAPTLMRLGHSQAGEKRRY
jgi:hypothetical protein